MSKDFDSWNREKKIVDQKVISRDFFFHEREIWWCSAGLNVGVEADGKNENFERPFLIIKKFNADMIWVLPLTSKEKRDGFYYKLDYEYLRSWVILTQIKTISTKRLLRKIESISEADFKKVISRIRNILSP
jgi:mRNA interferase MazF